MNTITKKLLVTNSIKIINAKNKSHESISQAHFKIFDACGKEFLKKNPKRKLRLIAGMGTVFWVIDNEILNAEFDAVRRMDGSTARSPYSKTWQCASNLSCDWDGFKAYDCRMNIAERSIDIFKPLLLALEFLYEHNQDGQSLCSHLSDMFFYKNGEDV